MNYEAYTNGWLSQRSCILEFSVFLVFKVYYDIERATRFQLICPFRPDVKLKLMHSVVLLKIPFLELCIDVA
jgi:hypothetical protein